MNSATNYNIINYNLTVMVHFIFSNVLVYTFYAVKKIIKVQLFLFEMSKTIQVELMNKNTSCVLK